MRRTAPRRSLRLLTLVVLSLCLLVVAVTARQAQSRSPLDGVIERVEQSGRYAFTADITQYNIPAATPRTVGKEISPDKIRLAGSSDLRDERFEMTLWSQGGSVLDPASGVSIKNDAEGRLWARQEGDWQEVQDFSAGIMPGGDFLHFLAGATDVVQHEPELVNGVSLTRYTFTLDSVAFAAFMRDQLQAQMLHNGELPAGAQLELSDTFTKMRGGGELWVGADGLPLRQINHLVFPEKDGVSVDSTIVVNYSDFEPLTGVAAWSLPAGAWAAAQRALWTVAALGLVALPLYFMVRYSRRRWVYTAVAVACTLTLLGNQPLLAYQSGQSQERLQDRQARQETMSAEADLLRDAQQEQETRWLRELSDVRATVADPAFSQAISTTLDSDLDGLTDAQERLLGTFIDQVDTDGDTISDYDEVTGFSYAGKMWYTNPLQADSNNDGQSDYSEWNIDLHATWDLDNDGIPDLFDRDNDGDGVPDRLDLSPFVAWAQPFDGDNPLQLQLDGLTSGKPVLAEFQIRPTNPDQLWYAFNPLDWPADQHGNIRDLNNSPDDIQIVPMLEIIMPSAPHNVPLVADSGVDVHFTNPNEAITGTMTLQAAPDAVTIDFEVYGQYYFSNPNRSWYAQIYAGRCGALTGPVGARSDVVSPYGSSAYSGTVTVSNVDLVKLAADAHAVTVVSDDGQFGACALIPRIAVEDGQVVDTALLDQYGISVRPLDAAQDGFAAYVPLSLVVDDPADLNNNEALPAIDTLRGGRVAFGAQMVYEAGLNWGAAHQINLVWQVNVAMDDDCRGAGAGCTPYEDQVQIVHVYEDEPWVLTGFNVREEHGAELAIVHEIPADDPDLADDGALVPLAVSLTESLVAGRPNAAGTGRDLTIAEIARRWDQGASVTITETMGITQSLQVETQQFATLDQLTFGAAEASTTLLTDEFGSYWSAGNPISPTLLYAYEWDFRAVNLDMEPHTPLVDTSGHTLRVDFSDGAVIPVSTIANVSLQPYAYDDTDGQWKAYEMASWFNELERRYRSVIDAAESDEAIANGQMATMQYFYLAMQQGQQRMVQMGSTLVTAQQWIKDSQATKIWSGVTAIPKLAYTLLIKAYITQRIARGITDFFKAMDKAYSILENSAGVANGYLRGFGTSLDMRSLERLGLSPAKFGLLITSLAAIAVGVIAVVAVLAVSAAGVFGEGGKLAFEIVVTIISAAVNFVVLVLAVKKGLEVVADGTQFLQIGWLGIEEGFLKAARVTAVIGLAVTVGFALGLLLFQLIGGSAPPGSAESNAAAAYFVASVVVALVTLIISLIPIVGAIIMAMIGIIDALLQLICLAGLSALKGVTGSDSCFTLLGAFTEALVKLFYVSDVAFRFEPGNGVSKDKIWPQLTQFDYGLRDPEGGFVVGNAVQFSAVLRGDLAPEFPDGYDAARAAFKPEHLSQTRIAANLSQSPTDLTPPAQPLGGWAFTPLIDITYNELVWPVPPVHVTRVFPFVKTTVPSLPVNSGYLVLDKPGVNAWYHLPVFLNVGMDVPIYACTMTLYCNGDFARQYINEPIASYPEFAIDILPATLDGFFARDWGTYYDQRVSNSFELWLSGLNEVFPGDVPPTGAPINGDKDFDGDGLLAAAHGGLDVNDLLVDTDGDTLPDGYEADFAFLGVANGGGDISLTSADGDGDGVCDADELRLGTQPLQVDTDRDGLSDGEEVWHRNCTTGVWEGGWTFDYGGGTTRVSSDPTLRDSDGDGLSDKLERDLHLSAPADFPYHPQVVNDVPLAFSYEFSGYDLYFAPGETFVYTTTLRNEINRPYYVKGTLERALPAPYGGGATIDYFGPLFDGQSQQILRGILVNPGATTQDAPIENAVAAQLLDSGNNVVIGPDTFVLNDTIVTTIDSDEPTSQLTLGQYVRAGTVNVLGGIASDPTSYVKTVEVEVTGSFGYTTASGAEAWAINWLAPAGEGSHTVNIRATDAVGNVQSPATTTSVIVDGTAPTVSAAQNGGGIIRPKATIQRATGLPLDGAVSDPAIGPNPGSGVAEVQVRVEPLSLGWYTATISGGAWDLILPLSRVAEDGSGVDDYSGTYTVTVRALDNVGNASADLIFPVQVDARAPQTIVESLIERTNVGGNGPLEDAGSVSLENAITASGTVITGTIADLGDVSSGLDVLEAAFVPAEAFDRLDDALVLLPLDDADGSARFFDASVNKLEVLCVLPAGRCPTGGVAGAYGDAQQFNPSQYVIVDTTMTAPATIAFWFKTSSANTGIFSLGSDFPGSGGYDADLYLVNGNVCAHLANAQPGEICSTGVDYADNGWHHVAFAIDDAAPSTLYLDGERAAQFNTFGALAGHGALFLGYARQASSYFTGAMDEFAAYNSAFSASQVASLYQPWTNATLSAAGPGVTDATWSLTVPDGLDGIYQLDLRGADQVGNRNDDARGTWNQWRGLIDTRAPLVDYQISFFGSGVAAKTEVVITAQDINLVQTNYASPCGDNPTIVQGQYTRTIEQRCTLDGHLPTAEQTMTVCDATGRCSDARPSAEHLLFGGWQNWTEPVDYIDPAIFVRPLQDGAPIEVLLETTQDVKGLDVDPLGGKVYWIEGAYPAAPAIYRANLDGSERQLLRSGLVWGNSNPAMAMGLAVNAPANQLYYGSGSAIYRSNLDGTGQVQIYAHNSSGCQTSRFQTFDPVIDSANGKLYWISHCREFTTYMLVGQIWRANLDGTSVELYYSGYQEGIHASAINGIQVANGFVWWVETDQRGFDNEYDGLWRMALSGPPPSQTPVPGRPAFDVDKYASIMSFDATNSYLYHDLGVTSLWRTDVATLQADVWLDFPFQEPPDPLYPIARLGEASATAVLQLDLPPDAIPANFDPPPLGSSVNEGGAGGQLSGGAYAEDGLQQLTVYVNDAPYYTRNWPNTLGPENALLTTQATWSTPWAPAAGVYTVTTQVTDWAGGVQTYTLPVQMVIDNTAPSVSIDVDGPINQAQLLQNSLAFTVTGTATDDSGVVSVAIEVDGVPAGTARLDGDTWSFRVATGDLEFGTMVVHATAYDGSGKSATDVEILAIDLVEPVQPLPTLTVDGVPITQSVLITGTSPTLALSWTAGSDANGIFEYYAGFTDSPTVTPGDLTPYVTPSTVNLSPAEASVVYPHLITEDFSGNLTVISLPPVYVDGPATPDLSLDIGYAGWRQTGGSLLSVDHEIEASARAQFSGLAAPQSFYLTWDTTHVILAWAGADWSVDGDLFIYYDYGGVGSATLYDPFGSSAIQFPDGFRPSAVIHVQDNQTASVYGYSGGTWYRAYDLNVDQIAHSVTEDGVPVLDIRAPGIGTGGSLKVMAVASEEGALKLWASAPSHNPLNSERVINAAAFDRALDTYELTQFFSWPSVTGGVVPNAGEPSAAHLEIAVTSDADAIGVGYLESDLLDLLTPGVALDGDGDGVPDVAIPYDELPVPVGPGATLNYTVTVTNRGTGPAADILLDPTTTGMTGLTPVTIPLLGAGATTTVTFAATATSPEAAELQLEVSDSTHAPFDWWWLVHRVDTDPPTGLALISPVGYVAPHTQTFQGVVTDASGVPTIEVAVFSGGDLVADVVCLDDPTPKDGLWSCPVDLGDLAGIAEVDVYVQALDEFGNVSNWAGPETLLVDDAPPAVALSAETQAALADGLITPAETLLTGTVTDDGDAVAVEICVDDGGLVPACYIQPLNGADGWAQEVDLGRLDAEPRTFSWQGIDAVGRRSPLLEQTVSLDAVAPQIAVTAFITDYNSVPFGSPIITGTVSDGGTAVTVTVRIEAPDATVTWQNANPVVLNAVQGQWNLAPTVTQPGIHLLTVEAIDAAGNVSAHGAYALVVGEPTAVTLGRRAGASGTAGGGVMALFAGMLLLLSGWAWRRRRRGMSMGD